jgi:hypothetical protein
MVDVFRGQTGRAVVRMFDAEGDETDHYDRMTGIIYSSTDATVISIVDEDVEPKDAEIVAHVASDVPQKLTCQFDGDPGDGVRTIMLESEEIMVLEPPPGEAVTGTFEVEFRPVGP